MEYIIAFFDVFVREAIIVPIAKLFKLYNMVIKNIIKKWVFLNMPILATTEKIRLLIKDTRK